MFTRITLLLVVFAALCSVAYTLGGAAGGRKQDTSGIPPEHAVSLALRYQQELALSSDQIAKLNQIHDAMAKEFAPLRERAEAIQHQMEDLQKSGKPDEETARKLQQEGDELGKKMQPLFERYAQMVGPILSQEQREKLMKLAQANSHQADGNEFVMMVVMQSRDQLSITPQQFTKLQYLQSDFIRAFAPLREQMELLQIEVKDKFGKSGEQPTDEYRDRGLSIQKAVTALQAQFSERAIKEVLLPEQKAKLEELLHGEHRSEQNGG